MTRDMTRHTDTLSVTNEQGYDYLIRYFSLSQMGRDVTRLNNTLSFTNDQGYD
jgi:hypothetical protein